MTDPRGRVAVVVLGMHRSGTGALARVLGLLGGELATELREGAEAGGRAGNWEAHAVTAFDERALALAGSGWDDPLELAPGWSESEQASRLIEEGAAVIAEQYPGTAPAVIKDPRICRLVGLWEAILERGGLEPRYLLAFRHPLEVAGSLAERNGFPPARSLALWLRHVIDAERSTRARPRALVSYERLLEDWRAALDPALTSLAPALAGAGAETSRRVEEALSPALRHHRAGPGDRDENGSPLGRLALDLHAALRAEAGAAGGETGLGAAVEAAAAELRRAEDILGATVEAERARRIEAEREVDRNRAVRHAAQERAERAREAAREARESAAAAEQRADAARGELDELRGSLSWRLTAPLRGLASAGRRKPPEPPPAPFVIGVGRSGTTLLRLMLDAHPQLAIPPETRFVPRLIRAASAPGATPEGIADLLEAERNWGDFGLGREAVLARLEAEGGSRGLSAAIAVRAFFGAYAERFGKSRWGDKTPPYGSRMPMIAAAVPEARFIHVIRDPRDVAASWIKFRRSRDDDPLTAEHWAQVWAATIVETRVKATRVPHYLEVRYEDLVAAPEPTLRRLCEAIDLAYDERMLSYHLSASERLAELAAGLPSGDRQPARSAGDRIAPHELTKQPPRPDRVGAWRDVLGAEEAAAVEGIAGGLLDDLPAPPAEADPGRSG